jgi:hypothetical protein
MKTGIAVLVFAGLAMAAGLTAVKNDRVAVTDETIKPGETATWPGDHPTEIVYFTDGSLDLGGKAVKVKRGECVFEGARKLTMKNTGSADVHFARTEFVGKGLQDIWGAAGLSPNYKLLFENRYTRIYDIRIPAGTKEPQHTHHDRVVVCLSGAQLKHLMPDGREEPSRLQNGEIVWRKGGTHIGQNLGTTDLWVIAVEPK